MIEVIKIRLETSLLELKGIGKKKAGYFRKLNLYTVGDLLSYYPRGYFDRGHVVPIASLSEETAYTFKGKVVDLATTKNYGRKDYLKLKLSDGSDYIDIMFFNATYLKNTFNMGVEYYFYGKLSRTGQFKQMVHPEHIISNSKDLKDFLRVCPLYGLTEGLNQNDFTKLFFQILNDKKFEIEDQLPPEVIETLKLCQREFAIRNIHYPQNREAYKVSKYRLVFEELFELQLSLMAIKKKVNVKDGVSFRDGQDEIEAFTKTLPFQLTGAQSRVWAEIESDLMSHKTMHRLVQGDVGSGKTIIAVMAMLAAAKSGYQSVMMAPTEILAIQHFESLKETLATYDIEVRLLTQNSKSDETIEAIKAGHAQIVVGTHAIIQDNIIFDNLGMVITDEQHRFGVAQRKKLSDKGDAPNVLIMTATPIPRTLSLVLYGDMDISSIDEMPAGRKSIKTHHVTASKMANMFDFIRQELDNGRQAYFVYPLIEESDKIDLKSAEATSIELAQGELAGYSVALLHGKMKNKEKEAIMNEFKEGRIQALISTTVIEVGINVPNSSIMVIEHSERFGLSTLHQLRGRVGRGAYQSYCFLVSESKGKVALERIKMMTETNDGFKIADKDLEIRGPGDFIGIKQHGLPEFKIANLLVHGKILKVAQDMAQKILFENMGGDRGDESVKTYIESVVQNFVM